MEGLEAGESDTHYIRMHRGQCNPFRLFWSYGKTAGELDPTIEHRGAADPKQRIAQTSGTVSTLRYAGIPLEGWSV